MKEQRPGPMSTSSALHIAINEAVAALRGEGVVAFPTDTLYGLGADTFCVEAVSRVFEIKGRREDMALPLLIGSLKQLESVAADVPSVAWDLVQRFWPGALTLILRKSAVVPNTVTGGRDTVALRMPNHHVPLALARQLGRPITGTSANISGGPDPITAEDVRRSLGRRIGYIVDGGPATGGVPSTIVELTGAIPILIRPGAISLHALCSVCPDLMTGAVR